MHSLSPWILIFGATSILAVAVDQSTIEAPSKYAPKSIAFHLTAYMHTCVCLSTAYGNEHRVRALIFVVEMWR